MVSPGVASRTAFRPGGVSFPPTPGFIANRRTQSGGDYLFPQLAALPPLPPLPQQSAHGIAAAQGSMQTHVGMTNPQVPGAASATIVNEIPGTNVYGNIAMAPPESGFVESADGFVSGELTTPTTEYTASGEFVSDAYMPSPFTGSTQVQGTVQGSVPMPEPEYQLPPPSTPISRSPSAQQYPPSTGPDGSVPLNEQSAPQVSTAQDALEAF